MKISTFALPGAAALALAGCSVNKDDAVENTDVNQPAADAFDDMTADPANDAANAEAAALGTQQQQLEQENAAAADENATTPSDDEEQNVSGM